MPTSRWKATSERKEISARDHEVIRRHLEFWQMVLANHTAKIAEMAKLDRKSVKFQRELEYLKNSASYLKQILYSLTRKVAYEPVPENWEVQN